MPWQIRCLNAEAPHCHEGLQGLEIREIWQQQPHRQLKRAVPPNFAEEDYPSTCHEGLQRWLQGLQKVGRIPQLFCKLLRHDANLLNGLKIGEIPIEIRPGIHKQHRARSRHILLVQSGHGIQPQVGTFLVGNEDLGTIRESGDPRSHGWVMVVDQQEVDPLLAFCSTLGTHPINPMAIAQSMFEWMARDIEKMVRGLSFAKLARGLKSISIVYGCLGKFENDSEGNELRH